MSYLIKRLTERRIWIKVFRERLTEPLHFNLISLFVFLFDSIRKKIAYDLILRPQQAFGILEAANQAKQSGLKHITILE